MAERYLHENQAQLGDASTRYGMLMLGYSGYSNDSDSSNVANDILVNGCVFKQVNLRAIELYGNATILGNRFEGSLPPFTGTPSEFLKSLSCFTYEDDFCDAPPVSLEEASKLRFGMNWHSAISFIAEPSTPVPTVIENNTIQGFVEGIVGGSLPDLSKVRMNTFRRIADHAFYSLGTVRSGQINNNVFERILSQAIKLGGHSARPEPDNVSDDNAAFYSSISFNHFRLIGSSAILMAGTRNHIEGNTHDAICDPSGWFNLTSFPFIWLTTYGGNTSPNVCGYHNHSAFNVINGNQSPRDIFIQQFDDPPWPQCLNTTHRGDRSIQGNQAGADQKIYVRERAVTAYAGQSLIGGLRLGNVPPYCPSCCRTALGVSYSPCVPPSPEPPECAASPGA